MKTAVVFYSMGGNTACAARRTAELLGADLIELKPKKQYPDKGFRKYLWGGKSAVMAEKPELLPYAFDPEEYEQVIFGFPVWAGNIAPPLRTFISENIPALAAKRLAAFACEGGSGAEKAFKKLCTCLGVKKLSSELILIDPKDRPDARNESKIRSFCDQCR